MCTCIDFKTKDHYFGRTLDLEYRFQEQVVITPRNYNFSLKNGQNINTKYAIIGMSSIISNYPLYAEATNEKGLSIAGLNFPKNAHFFQTKENKLNLAPYELIPYFLGTYSSIKEMRSDLENLNITNIPFSEEVGISDLHWMISDNDECIVIEQMQDGLKIYDNYIGVLTNNPPFPYHLININNYGNLTTQYQENRFSDKLNIKQYGQGMNAIGLPGDNSPTSRFIRASFNKLNSVCADDEESSITQFFHILDSVSMVQGSTITKEGKCDITTYSCCINTTKGVYYYKTYQNNQIAAIRLTDIEKTKKELSIYNLIETQQINYLN